jgi:hypothetical protein
MKRFDDHEQMILDQVAILLDEFPHEQGHKYVLLVETGAKWRVWSDNITDFECEGQPVPDELVGVWTMKYSRDLSRDCLSKCIEEDIWSKQ